VVPAGTAETGHDGAAVPDPAPIDHPASVEMRIVGIAGPARSL
jgi:hypothetical protein